LNYNLHFLSTASQVGLLNFEFQINQNAGGGRIAFLNIIGMPLALTGVQTAALCEFEEELKCPVCENVFEEPYSTHCEHNFCKECIVKALFKESRCPTCKSPTIPKDLQKNATYCNLVENFYLLKERLSVLQIKLPGTQDMLQSDRKPKKDDASQLHVEFSHSPETQDLLLSARKQEEDDASQVAVKPSDTPGTRDMSLNDGKMEEEEASQVDIQSSDSPGTQDLLLSVRKSKALLMKYKIVRCLCSGLNLSEFLQVKEIIEYLGGVCLDALPVDFTNMEFTHLIVQPQSESADGLHSVKMSLKYFFALSKGCSILNVSWVYACKEANEWLQEEQYQMNSNNGQEIRCRDAMGSSKSLFNGYNFILMFADGTPEETYDYKVYHETCLSMLSTMRYFDLQVRDLSYIMNLGDASTDFDLLACAKVKDLEPFPNSKPILLVEFHSPQDTSLHKKKICPRCTRLKRIKQHFENLHLPVTTLYYSFIFKAFIDQKLPDMGKFASSKIK